MGIALQISHSAREFSFGSEGVSAAGQLRVAVIDPDRDRRRAAARVLSNTAASVRQIPDYIAGQEDAQRILRQGFDIVAVCLDGNPELALAMVESLCRAGQSTVIVYTDHATQETMMRAMRAGAREFLRMPFDVVEVREALERAAERGTALPVDHVENAGLFVFLGAKGGSGTTTVACNFALALASEPGKRTLLIDLDLPQGDAALDLGLVASYTTREALAVADHLDSELLASMLVRHCSGLQVLAAPGRFSCEGLDAELSPESINKLIALAVEDFDAVVVDAGARMDLSGTEIFEKAAHIYLVAQAGIPELRNANRTIAALEPAQAAKLDVVLNRFSSKLFSSSDGVIEKALSKRAEWRIPSGIAAFAGEKERRVFSGRGEEDEGYRVIQSMARAACGLPVVQQKRHAFGWFR